MRERKGTIDCTVRRHIIQLGYANLFVVSSLLESDVKKDVQNSHKFCENESENVQEETLAIIKDE